jgi:hypothetical protein
MPAENSNFTQRGIERKTESSSGTSQFLCGSLFISTSLFSLLIFRSVEDAHLPARSRPAEGVGGEVRALLADAGAAQRGREERLHLPREGLAQSAKSVERS